MKGWGKNMDVNELERLKSYEEAIDLLKSVPEDMDYFDTVDRLRSMVHPTDAEIHGTPCRP